MLKTTQIVWTLTTSDQKKHLYELFARYLSLKTKDKHFEKKKSLFLRDIKHWSLKNLYPKSFDNTSFYRNISSYEKKSKRYNLNNFSI